jgi:hypothetical protein
MSNKIWVKEVLDSYFDPEGTFESLIASLEGIKASYPDYKDFEIEKEYGGHDESDTFKLVAMRLETDKEFEKRMKKLEKDKAAKKAEKELAEKEERKLYEKLKEKYEVYSLSKSK